MKQRLKRPSAAPRPEPAEPGQVYRLSCSYRQGFPNGIPSVATCKRSGDMPRCDSEAAVTGEEGFAQPALFGKMLPY